MRGMHNDVVLNCVGKFSGWWDWLQCSLVLQVLLLGGDNFYLLGRNVGMHVRLSADIPPQPRQETHHLDWATLHQIWDPSFRCLLGGTCELSANKHSCSLWNAWLLTGPEFALLWWNKCEDTKVLFCFEITGEILHRLITMERSSEVILQVDRSPRARCLVRCAFRLNPGWETCRRRTPGENKQCWDG